MTFNTSRRGFLRGVGGVAMLGATGCCTNWCKRSGKIRLAAVGIMGKGFSDWMPMLKSGLVEIVAFCDADANQRTAVLNHKQVKELGYADMLAKVPFYTDYRRMLDDQKKRSEAMRNASDFTNKVIEANAKALKISSSIVAKEAERGIFDMSTLEKTTSLMIDTVKEVETIHQKGIAERKAFEEKLVTLESHLNSSITHSIDTMKGEKKYLTGETKTLKELQGVAAE